MRNVKIYDAAKGYITSAEIWQSRVFSMLCDGICYFKTSTLDCITKMQINKKYHVGLYFWVYVLIARCADRAVLSSESAQILRLCTLTTPSICIKVFSTWEYSKPLGIPSIKTLTTSLIIATVVRITNIEKRNVHIGSTMFQLGWNISRSSLESCLEMMFTIDKPRYLLNHEISRYKGTWLDLDVKNKYVKSVKISRNFISGLWDVIKICTLITTELLKVWRYLKVND